MTYKESEVWKLVCSINEKHKNDVNIDIYEKILGNFSFFEGKCNRLEQITKDCQPKTIIEVGLNCGHSAAIMLSICPDANFYSFDIADRKYIVDAADSLSKMFSKFKFFKGDSKLTIGPATESLKDEVDLAIIDGDHSYKSVKSDLFFILPKMNLDGILVIDDVEESVVANAVKDTNMNNFELIETIHSERFTKNKFSDVAVYRRIS